MHTLGLHHSPKQWLPTAQQQQQQQQQQEEGVQVQCAYFRQL
jgi:hypothetical protein